METQMDYNSADEAQDSDKMLSKDETITKLSQLEKLYEEKKKVYYAVLSVIVLCGTLYWFVLPLSHQQMVLSSLHWKQTVHAHSWHIII